MRNGNIKKPENGTGLVRHLSPLSVWALAFGCSVGWGAFVMPGTTFLPIAGPVGTAIGVGVGMLIMFVIGMNYSFLMNRYPDAGGTFSYTKNVFGYDHAFLASWFMGLVYLAIIWANCTALPLIFRKLFGDVLQFGYLYTFVGYEVYVGEIMLSAAAVVIFGLVCLRGGKITSSVQIIMSVILITGVLIALGSVVFRGDGSAVNVKPDFSPSNPPATGAMFIMFLSPWAFAGFESISQSTEEFKFPVKKSLGIMAAALITAAAAYIILVFVAASAVPEGFGYGSWFEYTADLENADLSGVQSVPVFNAVSAAMGKPGLIVIAVTAAAGIITGLIGNTVAGSRLLCSIARDDLVGKKMGRINRRGVPRNAVIFLMTVSLGIPFLGRAAIGWVVDINTVGVTIAYAYTSAAALKEAVKTHKKANCAAGITGIIISLFFLLYFLLPNDWSASKLSTESYLMLLMWIIAGFIVFYLIFRHDKRMRIGKSTVVWAVLLILLFATSVIWVRESAKFKTETAVESYMQTERALIEERGVTLTPEESQKAETALRSGFDNVTGSIVLNTVLQFVIVTAAMLMIFKIYNSVQKRHMTAVEDKNIAEQSSHAKTTFLSNMSHDIRTPTNAIVGYATLAKREKDIPPTVSEYLSKIEASSGHLISLINDVLEMSRIESGKMELAPVPSDLNRIMDEVKNLFSAQMETKGIEYTVSCVDLKDAKVLCDANRFNRVLLNLISNAYKFTPEGGSVNVTLTQTGRDADKAYYAVSVRDTGIGMSPEFAAKVFEAYERERTATVEGIQGTGLGTAITKSIVDLMGGTIEVFSEQGKGSEFLINVSFDIDTEAEKSAGGTGADRGGGPDFAGMRLLLVEDDPENREIAKAMLEQLGFTVDIIDNGEDAVETVASCAPGKYAAVIMDIEMPVKDGYEAAKLIRSLKNPELSQIPIVALTAKAFSEDIAAARRAGMNAHISKPVNLEKLKKTMTDVLL